MPLQQEDGWPLGLQFVNGRIGGASRDVEFSGSVSFNTLFSGHETSSTDASSDLETESFHDRSTTLGSLTGITGLLELSSSSFRNWRQRCVRNSKSSQKKPRARFFFSLCARSHVDSDSAAGGGDGSKISSLGYFLEVERRACDAHTRNRRVPISYEPDGVGEPDSVSDGRVAAPHGGTGEACALTLKPHQPIAGPA